MLHLTSREKHGAKTMKFLALCIIPNLFLIPVVNSDNTMEKSLLELITGC